MFKQRAKAFAEIALVEQLHPAFYEKHHEEPLCLTTEPAGIGIQFGVSDLKAVNAEERPATMRPRHCTDGDSQSDFLFVCDGPLNRSKIETLANLVQFVKRLRFLDFVE
jgi:hypothetical protein